MTNEKKAEEYFNKHKYAHDNRNGKQETIHKKIYLDGLAEGRKEYSESPCTSCCITESLDSDLSDLNYQFVNLAANTKELEKENAELKKDKEWLDNTNNEQTEVILKLQAQIEKMKLDQKTAFDKGMKHLAKELKEYDRINGAWTDYFEHTVNKVLKWELERKDRTEWEFAE